ncbi:unnamed protein product [Rotaria sp. Silwood2]|nr:unnamed protein product [Rotaria sp. Silwood2]CAF4301066.1 unnamed protein product [Rotaria sp. Silwood2]
MGNRTSRNTVSRKKRHSCDTSSIYSSNKNSDRQGFYKHHMDTHYNMIDNVLNDHFIILHSNANIQQSAMNIHQDSLKIAMRDHIHAMSLNILNHQRYQKIIYNF